MQSVQLANERYGSAGCRRSCDCFYCRVNRFSLGCSAIITGDEGTLEQGRDARHPRKLNVTTHAVKARKSIGLLYIAELICASKNPSA